MMDLKHIKKTFVLARNCPTGVACIWSLIRYYGGDTTPWLIKNWSKTEHGVTKIGGLLEAARKIGFEAIIRKTTMNHLERIVFPLILYVEKDDGVKDFVICYGFDGRRFLVGDTSWGLNQYYPEEMEAMWIQGITLDLFAGEHFLLKKDHRNNLKKLISYLTQRGIEFRKKLLKDLIQKSACDCKKEIHWIKKIIPWFCIWGISNLALCIIGIDYSFYKGHYTSLLGWIGILSFSGILYKSASHWREKIGIKNWGKLKSIKKNHKAEKEQNSLWNWFCLKWSIFISTLLACLGWPDTPLGISIGIVSLSTINWIFVLIRIKEIVNIIYWIFIETKESLSLEIHKS